MKLVDEMVAHCAEPQTRSKLSSPALCHRPDSLGCTIQLDARPPRQVDLACMIYAHHKAEYGNGPKFPGIDFDSRQSRSTHARDQLPRASRGNCTTARNSCDTSCVNRTDRARISTVDDDLMFQLEEVAEEEDAETLAVEVARELSDDRLFLEQSATIWTPCSEYSATLRDDATSAISSFADASWGRRNTLDLLAQRLRDLGHPVKIREACGGGPGLIGLVNLNHVFMYVDGPDGEQVFIEPFLPQHFAVACPTETFEKRISSLPDVFVGDSSQLVHAVALLSREVENCFVAQGMHLPPWRQPHSMLTKWFPAVVRDGHPAMPLPSRHGGESSPTMLEILDAANDASDTLELQNLRDCLPVASFAA